MDLMGVHFSWCHFPKMFSKTHFSNRHVSIFLCRPGPNNNPCRKNPCRSVPDLGPRAGPLGPGPRPRDMSPSWPRIQGPGSWARPVGPKWAHFYTWAYS